MLERAFVFALTLTAAGVSSSQEVAAAPFTQDQPAWQRTDSQHFEVHYLPALARDLDRVIRSAERAYDLISRRLNFTFATKVPLVMFAPSGALTRGQVVTYATSDQVAPQHPHRSRIVLPLPEGDTQLDPLMVHELTHLLVGEIILPQAPGDGGVPRWVHEGIASYMADVWSDDDERLMRELVAAVTAWWTSDTSDAQRVQRPAGPSFSRRARCSPLAVSTCGCASACVDVTGEEMTMPTR